jgi:hypothetical protein
MAKYALNGEARMSVHAIFDIIIWASLPFLNVCAVIDRCWAQDLCWNEWDYGEWIIRII